MNLNYLRSFCATVQNNSISKAAKQLHLTQPGLSLQLQALENEVGSPLLIRSNKGVELTDAGKILYDYAATILSLEENILKDISDAKKPIDTLKIGACKAIGEYALPCSLYLFKRHHEAMSLQTTVSNSKDIAESIHNRTLNIGIVTNDTNDCRFESKHITSNPLLLVTAMPLIKTEIHAEELKKLPLILRAPGSGIREKILKELIKKGMSANELHPIFEIDSMEAIKTSVIAGKGVAFIPELSIKREISLGQLTVINIHDLPLDLDYYFIRLRDYRLTESEKAFEDFILSSKRGFC
jgi:DNA-binding transcriptional LysR family regulator